VNEYVLDKLDSKILQLLAKDGRIGCELAERIGLSLTPTLRRVRRLEAEGYISG
jgi:Lrp/AsnC family transcriptional regulator, leucine-responsive regulatory protein